MSQMSYRSADGSVTGFGRPKHLDLSPYSPVGHWKLSASDITLDSSGNGRDLGIVGSPLRSLGREGLGLGYRSNAEANRLYLDDASIRILGAITFGAWARRRQSGTQRIIRCGRGGPGSEDLNVLYSLVLNGSSSVNYFHQHDVNDATGSAVNGATEAADTLGEWVFAAATRDAAGTFVKVFLNGIKLAEGSVTAATGGGISDYQVGSPIDFDVTSDLQDAFVIADELSEAEMAIIYKRSVGMAP